MVVDLFGSIVRIFLFEGILFLCLSAGRHSAHPAYKNDQTRHVSQQ